MSANQIGLPDLIALRIMADCLHVFVSLLLSKWLWQQRLLPHTCLCSESAQFLTSCSSWPHACGTLKAKRGTGQPARQQAKNGSSEQICTWKVYSHCNGQFSAYSVHCVSPAVCCAGASWRGHQSLCVRQLPELLSLMLPAVTFPCSPEARSRINYSRCLS